MRLLGLKGRRQRADLTVMALARRAKVEDTVIADIERGDDAPWYFAVKLADALGVELRDLTAQSPPGAPNPP